MGQPGLVAVRTKTTTAATAAAAAVRGDHKRSVRDAGGRRMRGPKEVRDRSGGTVFGRQRRGQVRPVHAFGGQFRETRIGRRTRTGSTDQRQGGEIVEQRILEIFPPPP